MSAEGILNQPGIGNASSGGTITAEQLARAFDDSLSNFEPSQSQPAWERRPPRWGSGDEISGLTTVQLHTGGLFDGEPHGETPIHLVRRTDRGTPGPLLCGIDHHTLPIGFSVGGGAHTPALGDKDPATAPCTVCVLVAARMLLGAGYLPITGAVGGMRAKRAVLDELVRIGAGRHA